MGLLSYKIDTQQVGSICLQMPVCFLSLRIHQGIKADVEMGIRITEKHDHMSNGRGRGNDAILVIRRRNNSLLHSTLNSGNTPRSLGVR
jgi:hypothetical protein